MTASIILTPYATDHGPDTPEGWAAYLHQRGDVPDETVISGEEWTGEGLHDVALIYRADPPRCEVVARD